MPTYGGPPAPSNPVHMSRPSSTESHRSTTSRSISQTMSFPGNETGTRYHDTDGSLSTAERYHVRAESQNQGPSAGPHPQNGYPSEKNAYPLPAQPHREIQVHDQGSIRPESRQPNTGSHQPPMTSQSVQSTPTQQLYQTPHSQVPSQYHVRSFFTFLTLLAMVLRFSSRRNDRLFHLPLWLPPLGDPLILRKDREVPYRLVHLRVGVTIYIAYLNTHRGLVRLQLRALSFFMHKKVNSVTNR